MPKQCHRPYFPESRAGSMLVWKTLPDTEPVWWSATTVLSDLGGILD